MFNIWNYTENQTVSYMLWNLCLKYVALFKLISFNCTITHILSQHHSPRRDCASLTTHLHSLLSSAIRLYPQTPSLPQVCSFGPQVFLPFFCHLTHCVQCNGKINYFLWYFSRIMITLTCGNHIYNEEWMATLCIDTIINAHNYFIIYYFLIFMFLSLTKK